MTESREGTSDVSKRGATAPEAVSETATATANRGMPTPMSPERATDKRFMQRHKNAMKARAGHRRNIRRSNTNG